MKYFVTYTVLRIALFIACWGVIAGAATIFFDNGTKVGIWSFVAAAVISSLLSLRLLSGPREKFAASVEARAARAAARFEEMKTSEDAD
ncbi:MAG: DUF4229 domain-containing protein [Marmoricola sp.]